MKVESLKRASALALGVTMAFSVVAAPVAVLAEEGTEEVTTEYGTEVATDYYAVEATEYATEEVAPTDDVSYDATEEVADYATEEVTEELATEEDEEEVIAITPIFETITTTETVNLRFAVGESAFTRNGTTHTMEAEAFNRSGRVMLPVNAVAIALDAEVNVTGEVATIVTGETTISLPLNQELPGNMGTPVVENNVVFVPLGYIASQIGATTAWDSANSAAYVTFTITTVEVVEVEPATEDVAEEATEEVSDYVTEETTEEVFDYATEASEEVVTEEVSTEVTEEVSDEYVSEETTEVATEEDYSTEA